MHKYRTRCLVAAHVCAIALTVIGASTASAQTTATTSPKTDPAVAPPLFTVTHDATLKGAGTAASPLGIIDSPTVSGSLTVEGVVLAGRVVTQTSDVTGDLTVEGSIKVTSSTDDAIDARGASRSGGSGIAGAGVVARGGDGVVSTAGGPGLVGQGGVGTSVNSGVGVEGFGGQASTSAAPGAGVIGFGGPNGGGGVGVRGIGGVTDNRPGGTGVLAEGGAFVGEADGGIGLSAIGGLGRGNGHFTGPGIIAEPGHSENGAALGAAGVFIGDVLITGRLVKGSGSFKIDHPLDPENRYLSHSFVESPDMMNIYNGNITTDVNGDAVVDLPAYFSALNREFRYQLTAIGTFTQAIIAEKINDNHFRIKTSVPNVEVSWQVTGVRHDAYADKHRIVVEEDKPAQERGFYLHPEARGQPTDKGVLEIRRR